MPTTEPNAMVKNESLRHVMVVGGSVDDWNSIPREAWQAWIDEVGEVARAAGVRWLTLLPCAPSGRGASADVDRGNFHHDGTDVIVEPFADGRERFAAAIRRMGSDEPVNEASIAEVLYEPADSEPDLVVVYGPPTQLPQSLVWELAYAELVFTDAIWAHTGTTVLADAFADFAHRRRRFGGLDD